MQQKTSSKQEIEINPQLLPASTKKYHDSPLQYLLQRAPKSTLWSPSSLKQLLTDIATAYLSPAEGVHYHNVTHGFDVMKTMNQMYIMTRLVEKLGMTEEEHMLYLVAAFGHDCGHEGFTNQYYINGNKGLAVTYLWASPLENMHASKVLGFFVKNQINISLKMKKKIASMILATDNAYHFSKLAALKQMADQKKDIKANEDLILGAVLHASDISNPAKDLDTFFKWSNLVEAEFHRQRQVVSNTKMKELTYEEKVKSMLGFSQKLVKPFYIQLQAVLPGIQPLVKKIEENIDKLTKIDQKKQQQKPKKQ